MPWRDLRPAVAATALVVASPGAGQQSSPLALDRLEEEFVENAITCLNAQQKHPSSIEKFLRDSGYETVEPPDDFRDKVRIFMIPQTYHNITVDLSHSGCSVSWSPDQSQSDDLLAGRLAVALIDRASKGDLAPFQPGQLRTQADRFDYSFVSGAVSSTIITKAEPAGLTVIFSAINLESLRNLMRDKGIN